MFNPLLASAALNSTSTTPPPGEPPTQPVDNNLRSAWNDYIKFLDKKGLKGHPSLDHNDLGMKMIDQYRKEHPGTPLSRESIIPIQQEFSRYRDARLKEVESGKGAFGPGVTKDNFLKALSIVDNIPGQRTTSFSFPQGWNGTENKGYMRSDKSAVDQIYK